MWLCPSRNAAVIARGIQSAVLLLGYQAAINASSRQQMVIMEHMEQMDTTAVTWQRFLARFKSEQISE
jgi:hypothetical protein